MALDGIVYLLEMNVAGLTNAWVLGVSRLGHSTILKTAAVIGAAIAPVSGIISGSITRGRNDLFSPIEPGTATLVVDNADGRFSPDYLSSPYYPDMTLMRQVRISAKYLTAAQWSPLFYGYVTRITPDDNGPADSNVTIECVDWLGKVANAPIAYDGLAETDYARFGAIVTAAGTDGLPVIVYGHANNAEQVRAKDYGTSNTRALAALQELATNTLGTVYHGRDGSINYKTRHGRWQYPGGFTALHYLDQPGLNADPAVVPYTALPYELDVQTLFNSVVVQASGGAEAAQTATDPASIARYGLREMPTLSLALLRDHCAPCLAESLLAAQTAPRARIKGVTIDCDASPAGASSWVDDAFQLDLGDTLRVRKQEPGHVSIDRYMRVEQVRHTFAGETRTHTIDLTLSDRDLAGPQPWMLGVGGLGHTTPLVY